MLGLFLALIATPDTVELSLGQALERAFRSSPTAAEASASKCEGSIKLAQGIVALLPTPTAALGYGRTESRLGFLPDSTIVAKGWTGSLTLNQVVFDPQVFAGVAGAVVYSGYYAADAQDRRARLVFEVTRDYLGLLSARLLRDAAASALARADDNLRLTREKERLGSASRIEAMRSEVFRSQAEISLLSADRALAVAHTSFLATAGMSHNIAVNPVEQLTEPARFEYEDRDRLAEEIERVNPGARMSARAATVSQLNRVASVARALPSVSANWSSRYADTVFPSSPSLWTDKDEVSYGIQLSFPLLDLKSYVLNIAQASTDSRRTQAAANRTRLQLRSAATAAVLGYEEARLRYDYTRRNLELNQELYRLAQQQRKLGAISMLDFFSVETNLTQAQAAYISALSDTYVQAAQISYLMGRAGPAAR